MDSFQNAGLWWEPDNEAEQAVGLLSFDSSQGFVLEIPFGSVLELDEFGSPLRDSARTPVLHGLLRNGRSVTLANAVMTDSSINFPGGRREVHKALRGFVGGVACEANPVIDRVRVSYSHLRDWVGSHPSRMRMLFEDERPTGEVHYRYEPTESVELSAGDGWRLSLSHTARQAMPSVTGFSVSHDCILLLELDQPCDFEAVDERFLEPLWQFFVFALDAPTSTTDFKIHLADADEWLEVGQAQSSVRDRGETVDPDSMLLSMPRIGERLAPLLREWLEIEGDLRRAVSLLAGLESDRDVPSDLRFVAAAQALEAVSRVGVDDRDLPREEHRRRRNLVRDSIDDEVVREWAWAGLSYNRRGADALLRDLLDRIGEYVLELLPDRERFLRDHRDNRNFYAHRSDPGSRLLQPGELWVHTQGVMLLLKSATLLMLGYSQEEIAEVMRSCQTCLSWTRMLAEVYVIGGETEQGTA